MKVMGCDNVHFIQAIRGGMVVKFCNVDSHGRPAIKSKTLHDVYKSEDAKRLGMFPRTSSRTMHAGAAFQFGKVKRASRRPIKYCYFVDEDLGSDLDDDTALKDLKNRSKKRKSLRSNEKPNHVYVDEKLIVDESDLDEPLINLKLKKPKSSKEKNKCINRSGASFLPTAFAIKPEQNFVSESSQQVGGEMAPIICDKVKVEEAEELGCHSDSSLANDSFIGYNEEPSPSGDVSNEFPEIVLCEYRETQWSTEEHQNFLTNEIPENDSEDIKPMYMLVPWDGISDELETLEWDCQEVLDLHPLAIETQNEGTEEQSCKSSPSDNQNPDLFNHPRSSFTMKVLSEQISSSSMQVPGMSIDFPDEQDDSPSNPDRNNSSSWDSMISLKTDDYFDSMEDTIADKEQLLLCTSEDIDKNGFNSCGHLEDELLTSEDNQTSLSPITGLENQSCNENQTFDKTLLSPVSHQLPEKLLSKRKVISPSSQKRLRLAMNSEDFCNDVDQYNVSRCEGKLVKKPSEKNSPPLSSETSQAKKNVTLGQGNPLTQRKYIICPRHSTDKSQNTKGSIEGPCVSRSLPKFSSASTSIQSCSESAIAFSQRQMHDTEALVAKLMNELNSMKEIVEQKLLFEAYRSVSLKNDADEVKSVIRSASKVEVATRKWLTMMSKDCNRFCTIMKLTPETDTGSKNVRRKKKKIVFADEVGEKLCHVNFFEDGLSSPPKSNAVKPEDCLM